MCPWAILQALYQRIYMWAWHGAWYWTISQRSCCGRSCSGFHGPSSSNYRSFGSNGELSFTALPSNASPGLHVYTSLACFWEILILNIPLHSSLPTCHLSIMPSFQSCAWATHMMIMTELQLANKKVVWLWVVLYFPHQRTVMEKLKWKPAKEGKLVF